MKCKINKSQNTHFTNLLVLEKDHNKKKSENWKKQTKENPFLLKLKEHMVNSWKIIKDNEHVIKTFSFVKILSCSRKYYFFKRKKTYFY